MAAGLCAQVPSFVAKRWKGICEQSMQGPGPVGPKLGTITYSLLAADQAAAAAGSAGPNYKIELSLDSECSIAAGLPRVPVS